MEGMPSGDDPAPQDIGYYAPQGDVVLYYGDVGYWTGIARIGRFDADPQILAQQTGDLIATLERGA